MLFITITGLALININNTKENFLNKKQMKTNLMDLLVIVLLPCVLFSSLFNYWVNANLLFKFIFNTLLVSIFLVHFMVHRIRNMETDNYWMEFRSKCLDVYDQYRRETSTYIFTVKKGKIKIKYKRVKRIFLVTILTLTFILTCENMSILLMENLYDIKFSLSDTDFFSRFMISIPTKIAGIFIIYYLYVYVNSNRKVSLISTFTDNKIFRRIVYAELLSVLILSLGLNRLIVGDGYFQGLSNNYKLAILIGIYSLFLLQFLITTMVLYMKQIKLKELGT